jgi:tocopherol cyclase
MIDGKEIDFNHGKGYIEKNWGKAFPYSWIWVQSNNFSHNKTSLSCSLAHIPFSFFSFRGFLIGLYVDGTFYSFTTINRSKIQVQLSGADVSIQVENRQFSLKIKTRTSSENFMLLNGPRDGKMMPLVQENLQGEVQVILRDKEYNKTIFEDKGYCTGIEYGGKQMMVLDR